jgi:hypothetical protein
VSDLQKKTLKEEEVSTDIDLEKLLGGAARNEAVRAVFFEAAVDRLQKRLDEGRSVNGQLGTYSESYKNSLAFKVFGKSNPVNMQLTGDMLTSISELDSKNSKMKIGIIDELEAAKAYAHMTGFKGHPTLDGKVRKREWFGWTDKELKEIANAIKPEVNKKNTISDAAALKLLEKLVG